MVAQPCSCHASRSAPCRCFRPESRGVYGLADVHEVRANFYCQGYLANQVTRVRADHATAQDLALA